MKNSKLKYSIQLMLSIIIVFFSFEAFSKHVYNSLENIVIDNISTIFGVSSLSPFTSQINLFAAVVALISIPQFIAKIINPEYEIPYILYIARFVVVCNLLLVFLVVVFLLTPILAISTANIYESIITMFWNSNLYTHLLIPLIFICSFIFIDDHKNIDVKQKFIALIPIFIYAIEIVLFMFIIKSWDEDFYYLQTIYQKTGVFGLVGIFIMISGLLYGICSIVKKIVEKSSRKFQTDNNKKI